MINSIDEFLTLTVDQNLLFNINPRRCPSLGYIGYLWLLRFIDEENILEQIGSFYQFKLIRLGATSAGTLSKTTRVDNYPGGIC